MTRMPRRVVGGGLALVLFGALLAWGGSHGGSTPLRAAWGRNGAAAVSRAGGGVTQGPAHDAARIPSSDPVPELAGNATDRRSSAQAQPKRPSQPLIERAPPPVAARTLDRLRTLDGDAYQRLRDRSERARRLDARLERHVQRLQERLDQASGSERARLEADLRILERNGRLRRRQQLVARQLAERPTAP